mmetsp:Transcript_2198/g.5616  ORF Transcript_2198/g.5616 Transcript_2198/m.5616 type:complete len:238 (-) Transcript_2198:295-1008(-)
MSSECGLNMTFPMANQTGCVGYLAYKCLCGVDIVCCDDGTTCEACYESDDGDRLFSFSWPLVAAWYAMLVVLFCFGRRGRLINHRCFFFGRRTTEDSSTDETTRELEIAPVVKTRRLVDADIGDEPPSCVICLNRLVVDDEVAALDCPHLYHSECIVEWLRRKSSCPLCAQHIDVEDASNARPDDARPAARRPRSLSLFRLPRRSRSASARPSSSRSTSPADDDASRSLDDDDQTSL